jgi:hypothetical protein
MGCHKIPTKIGNKVKEFFFCNFQEKRGKKSMWEIMKFDFMLSAEKCGGPSRENLPGSCNNVSASGYPVNKQKNR